MLKDAIGATRGCLIGLLALVAPLPASAQSPPERQAAPEAAGAARLSADMVKTGLYVINGGGGNTLLRFSGDGLILVDGKLPGNYRTLMSQVRKLDKLSDLPVRVLIVTDHHDSHSGDNAQFLAAAVAIIAQENAKRRFPTYTAPAGAAALAPIVGYDREYTLRLGGVEVQLRHFGPARTDGDTVVYFVGQKTVAVGDLYAPGTPEPDFSAGGSLVNWGSTLAEVLKLDFDTVVPSEGPPVSRAAFQSFKTKIDAVAARAAALVKNGTPKDQLMSQLKTDDLGWRFDFSGAQLEAFYAELTAKP